uniref:Uncharacterized protein n=1 Tax=Acrobeloides nanus TaxID=290746 RepID=A0A914DFM8_9BILA
MFYLRNLKEELGSVRKESDQGGDLVQVALSPIVMFVHNESESYTYSRKIDPIVEKVKSILSQDCPTPLYDVFHGVHMTPLQQLQHAFAKFLDQVQPRGDSIVISEYADKLEMFKFQEEYVIKLAEAVMYCAPFAVLPFEDKSIQILGGRFLKSQ